MYVDVTEMVPSTLTFGDLVQEGIYLFQHGIDPYSGGMFRHVSACSQWKKTRLLFVAPVAAATVTILYRATLERGYGETSVDNMRCYLRLVPCKSMESEAATT